MSNAIKIQPSELREVAQAMRSANERNLGGIKARITSRNTDNEQLASQLTSRQEILYSRMFEQVDNAGLARLIATFGDSYHKRTDNRRIINRAVDQSLPSSMSDRFLLDFPGVASNDVRWFVGGNRWGGVHGGDGTLRRTYNAVENTIGLLLTEIDRQRDRLNDFAISGASSRHHTPRNGRGNRAFITRLEHVSNDAVRATRGVGGVRSGQSDAMVATVRNMLEALSRNIEVAQAKGEELAAQAESLANNEQAFDRQASNSFSNRMQSISHTSQIMRSQVELAIYRPDLLSDGIGLESARTEQYEERYRTLERNLTTNMFEVADFIASQTGRNNISTLCENALTAINNWETSINRTVSFEIRERVETTTPDPTCAFNTPVTTETQRWGSRDTRNKTLGQYLSGNLVENIAVAKTTIREWQTAFTNTINRANNFTTSMNNDSHLKNLDTRTANAIFPGNRLTNLQTFATNTKNTLERQANTYTNFANIIRTNMRGVTIMAYARALDRGAEYFRAVAQTLESDFWQGAHLGEYSSDSTRPFGGMRTFILDTAGKARNTVIGNGASVARNASRGNRHFGRSVAGMLQPRNAAGNRWVTDTSSVNRRATRAFRNLSARDSGWLGTGFRAANAGLNIWTAVNYFNYGRNKNDGSVGRGISFAGYMLGTQSLSKGKGLSTVGKMLTSFGNSGKAGAAGKAVAGTGKAMTKIGTTIYTKGVGKVATSKVVVGAGKGLAKIGLGVIGVKAAPIIAVAAVGVGVAMGAKWLYNNFAPVTNVVNAIGDGISAVGNAISSGFNAINPFRRRPA